MKTKKAVCDEFEKKILIELGWSMKINARSFSTKFTRIRKNHLFLSSFVIGALSLVPSCHSREKTMKAMSVIDSAVYNLELLATRAWLKQSGTGQPLDIPKFIARDNICSSAVLLNSKNITPLMCVPAKVDITKIDDRRMVQIRLSPGARESNIVELMREAMSTYSLDNLTLSQGDIARFQKSIDKLSKADPSIQKAITKGWISREGKTYPSLEALFSNSRHNSIEVLNAMRKILLAPYDSYTDSDGIITLTFRPNSDMFN
jgi:hypothetical protein